MTISTASKTYDNFNCFRNFKGILYIKQDSKSENSQYTKSNKKEKDIKTNLDETLMWLTQTSFLAHMELRQIVGSLSHFGPIYPLAQTHKPLTHLNPAWQDGAAK